MRAREKPYPTPVTRKPSMNKLMAWMDDGVAKATDGCKVEPDAMCDHGYPSWLLHLGLI
jgi:hypothetical protein